MNTILYTNKSYNYKQIRLRMDPDEGILWLYMNPTGRQCFSKELLKDMSIQHSILMSNRGKYYYDNKYHSVFYQVLTSESNKPYNLGGDLELFVKYIKDRDRKSLTEYAKLCLDVLYPTVINFDSNVTTISLVRGQALGGGFESALSSSFLIAEQSAKLGLPEILFNLFPGMGAYHLLAQKLPVSQVEKIIMSGKIFCAEELYDMGIIDVIAKDGKGEDTVYDFVNKHKRNWKTQIAIQKVRNEYRRITYIDLLRVCNIWVEAALNLEDKDIKIMERLIKAQYRLMNTEHVNVENRAIA